MKPEINCEACGVRPEDSYIRLIFILIELRYGYPTEIYPPMIDDGVFAMVIIACYLELHTHVRRKGKSCLYPIRLCHAEQLSLVLVVR